MFNNLEDKIENLVKDTLHTFGLEVVRIRILSGPMKVIEILIAKINDEKVSIIDCQEASVHISAILDVEDIIPGAYKLEISSAGVERPLVKIDDFTRFKGNVIDISFKTRVNDMKKIQALLKEVSNQKLILEHKANIIEVDFANVKSANIALTDELFRKILRG